MVVINEVYGEVWKKFAAFISWRFCRGKMLGCFLCVSLNLKFLELEVLWIVERTIFYLIIRSKYRDDKENL